MAEALKIILYPDPRLKKANETVIAFDESLRKLAVDMFRLMREASGVGLAAPQVGVNLRMFVANPSGEAGDDHVYINPSLSDPDDEDEAEEGCLSLPDIHVKVYRNKGKCAHSKRKTWKGTHSNRSALASPLASGSMSLTISMESC